MAIGPSVGAMKKIFSLRAGKNKMQSQKPAETKSKGGTIFSSGGKLNVRKM